MAQVDSLMQRLSSTNGKEKLEVLNQLTAIDSFHFMEYHRQALQLADELGDVSGEVDALCAIGDHYYGEMEPDSALSYYTKGLNISRKHQLQHSAIMCLDKSGAAMEDKNRYDQALLLYNEALSESRKSGDKKEIAGAVEHLGIFHLYQRNDSLALKCFNEQLQFEKQLNDSSAMAVCLNNIGLVYFNRGEYSNCILHYQQSLDIEEKLNRVNSVAQSHVNIGIAYKDEGTYDKALDNLLMAARYFEKGGISKELGSCYNTIGIVLMELGQTDNALYYHFESLRIREKINNKRGIAGSLTNIGNTYIVQKKYNLALEYLNKSVKIKEELGDKALLASSLDLLGEVYFLKQDYVQAEKFYLQSMQLKGEVEDPKGKATTLDNLGTLYLKWKKYDLALGNLDEGRKIAAAIGAKTVLLANYEITINVLREKGDFAKAVLYFAQYTALKDSVLNEQKSKALAEMQVKYETEKKEQQIMLMGEQEKSQAAVVSKQHVLIYSLIAGTLLLFLIVLISLKAYRTGIKANRQSKVIIQQKQMMIEQKQVVMKELHHRVKNNLQVLSSLLNLQQIRLEDEATKEAIQAVEHRLNAMLLIHQDLYGESVDSQVNLHEYLQKLIDNLLYSFGYSKDKLKINFLVEMVSLDADKALNIGFICNEVISNSFKHAFSKTDQPELSISLKQENELLLFSIADNGQGMPIEKNIEKTNSFGLRLIQMFIKDLHGNINIVSNQMGSHFEFIIPLNKTSL